MPSQKLEDHSLFVQVLHNGRMNRKNLPPLHALLAFEATARLGSYTRASAERHLSHSSVSRAVALVEHWVGEPLFQRNGPRLTLTSAGHGLQQRLSEPLQALHDVLGNAEGDPGPALRVTVHVVSSLAHGWLLPRLQSLRSSNGRLQITLQLAYAVESLAPSEPAVAIRIGSSSSRSGLRCWLLWRERMIAVASPEWIGRWGRDPSRWPADQRLRHTGQAWPRRIGGIRLPDPAGLASNDAMLVVHAALLGQGVAWVRESLAEPWIDGGALESLVEQGEELTDQSVWLVCRDEMAGHPGVRAFCDWIRGEAREWAAGRSA